MVAVPWVRVGSVLPGQLFQGSPFSVPREDALQGAWGNEVH